MGAPTERATAVERKQREWSLRREWTRAFALMLVLLLLAAAMAITGLWDVVDQVSASARHLRQETALISVLQTEIVNHEEVGHKLLSDEPVDRTAYLEAQQELSIRFAQAERLFPSANGMRATVFEAERSWQVGLTTYGLWGSELQSLHGNHEAENPIYGASSDSSVALIDSLQGPSLVALDRGLDHGGNLETDLVVTLCGLFGLALGCTAYFRRKMVKDLLEPVAHMRHGVSRLHAGHFDHHIEIKRHDELGELAEAFNEMAGALQESHAMLTVRATHDSLTGLANRAALTDRLAASLNSGSERRRRQESLLFIDVDDFKEVNDSLGHEGGDALLVQLAARLKSCVRPFDFVARLGGDEFAIIIAEDEAGHAAAEVAERILTSLQAPFHLTGTSHTVSVSIGVTQKDPSTADVAELLRRADFAMYMAKGSGKGRYQIFDAQFHDNMVERTALKADLAQADPNGELRVVYQPITNLASGEILGVEALLRWQHPTLGLLAPADFISLAEQTGDIDALGCWVLRAAIDQVAQWRQTIPNCAALWVTVNLSPIQLCTPKSMAAVHAIVEDPCVESEHVILEITESALATDIDSAAASLERLRTAGARVAIDDFGTGFSTLATLANLPVDILKIDREFVSGRTTAASAPVLDGILGLAERLSLAVIAEGVETVEQLDLLRSLNCPMGQGFLLGRPMAAHHLESLLAQGSAIQA